MVATDEQIICPNCGAALGKTKKFCTECGKKLPVSPAAEEVKDEIAMQETQKFQVPSHEESDMAEAVKAVFQENDEKKPHRKFWSGKKDKAVKKESKELTSEEEELDPKQKTIVDFSALAGSTLDDSPYEPISAWGYIGIMALLLVPVIGWIFAIVWACGGCRKINKRNMARGYLLVLALLAVFMICAVLAFYKIAPAVLENSPELAKTSINQDAVYSVGGTQPAANDQAQNFDEGDGSLFVFLEGLGNELWSAYYDREQMGGAELSAILDNNTDALLELGYSEKSVDQVLNIVNGDDEALASLLNVLSTKQDTEE